MAADLDFRLDAAASKLPFYILDVAVGSAKKVLLPPDYKVSVTHIGQKADATDSAVGDYVVLMYQSDAMVATTAAGRKMILFPSGGGGGAFRGVDILTAGADGDYEIQLQAVASSAKVQFVLSPMERR